MVDAPMRRAAELFDGRSMPDDDAGRLFARGGPEEAQRRIVFFLTRGIHAADADRSRDEPGVRRGASPVGRPLNGGFGLLPVQLRSRSCTLPATGHGRFERRTAPSSTAGMKAATIAERPASSFAAVTIASRAMRALGGPRDHTVRVMCGHPISTDADGMNASSMNASNCTCAGARARVRDNARSSCCPGRTGGRRRFMRWRSCSTRSFAGSARDHVDLGFVTHEPSFVDAAGPRMHEIIARHFTDRGIDAQASERLVEVRAHEASFADGSIERFDLLVTAAPHRAGVGYEGFPVDEHGFVRVEGAARQVVGHPEIYAPGDAGDCRLKDALLALLQADAAADHVAGGRAFPGRTGTAVHGPRVSGDARRPRGVTPGGLSHLNRVMTAHHEPDPAVPQHVRARPGDPRRVPASAASSDSMNTGTP